MNQLQDKTVGRTAGAGTGTEEIRKLALRAIAANRIVAATNVSDLEDGDGIFSEIHDKANDLTIDTQRALARSLGWLVGQGDMAMNISEAGRRLFDEITNGIASTDNIARAFSEETGEALLPSSSQGTLILRHDDKGYATLHEPDEDGLAGDLVASVWRDDWLLSLQAARPPLQKQGEEA